LDQVGNQVGAPLQHHIDLGPSGIHGFALNGHLVAPVEVHGTEKKRDNQKNHDQHNYGFHVHTSFEQIEKS
jgi:hypothetical protein